MRLSLLPLLSVMACGVSGGGPAPAADIALICPQPTTEATARLCTALEAGLTQRGYRLSQDPAVRTRLILDADSPGAAILTARLTVERDGARQIGEQGQLTAMDSAGIPDAQIDQFARTLLARAPLPPKNDM